MDVTKIINHFGIRNQINKLIEEIAELAIELEDFDTDDNHAGLIDEFADVKLLIKQIEQHLEIEKQVGARFFEKYNRTLDRIDTGYYEMEIK